MSSVLTPVSSIKHPFRGSEADVMDVDQLCEMLVKVQEEKGRLQACEWELRSALAMLTDGDAKTRKVVGSKYRATVTWPPDRWNQATLAELYATDINRSWNYIAVGSYKPQLKNIGRMEATSGNAEFEEFKSVLLNARQRATSPPSVKVDEAAGDLS